MSIMLVHTTGPAATYSCCTTPGRRKNRYLCAVVVVLHEQGRVKSLGSELIVYELKLKHDQRMHSIKLRQHETHKTAYKTQPERSIMHVHYTITRHIQQLTTNC